MKKSKRLAAIALSAMLVIGGTSMAVISGCGGNENPDTDIVSPEKTVSSIAVTTPPTKTAYVEGETFDKTGMVVTATYSDNTKEAVTGYTVDKTTLSDGDTSVTITYEGKTTTQAITVTAATKVLLTLHSDSEGAQDIEFKNDNTVIISAMGQSLECEWAINNYDLIEIKADPQVAGYVQFVSSVSEGNFKFEIVMSFGGTIEYLCPFADYASALGITIKEVGRVEVEDDYFAIKNDGTYQMSLDGTESTGSVVYTSADNSEDETASLVLVPEDGEAITAAKGANDNIFTIEETFVIPEGRLLYWLGYAVAGYTNADGNLEVYFFSDNTVSIVYENNSGTLVEYGRSLCTFMYDNNDILNLSLRITCLAPAAYGGPTLSCEYDSDEDLFTFTLTENIIDWATMSSTVGDTFTLELDGTAIRLLAGCRRSGRNDFRLLR